MIHMIPVVLVTMITAILFQKSTADPVHQYQLSMKLINDYISQHNNDLLLNESPNDICQRQFISNTKGKVVCQQAGNSLGEFLTAFAYAIIINRTILVKPITSYDCSNGLYLQDWLPNMKLIKQALEKAQCPLLKSIHFNGRVPCNFTNLDYKYVTVNYLFNQVYDEANLQYDSTIRPRTLDRIQQLFTSNFEGNGRFEGYGLLANSSLQFSSITKQAISPYISPILQQGTQQANIVRISAHLRHADNHDLRNPLYSLAHDLSFLKAIEFIYNNIKVTNNDLTCIVFVASDRPLSIERIVNGSQLIGCQVYYVQIDTKQQLQQQNILTTTNEVDEHGPNARGLRQIADWYLLTHGDYFIGSYSSTFSFLIANYIALHSKHRISFSGITRNNNSSSELSPLHWVTTSGEIKSVWMHPKFSKESHCAMKN